MRFEPPLIPATLIRRYKRFLADCRLESGQEITAHCPNPGSMMGLAETGCRVWLQPNDNPKTKLGFGWKLVDHENGHFTSIDTSGANRVLREALNARKVPELSDYETCRAEVPYGTASRIDFLLSQPGLPDAYVEVKSATLCRQPGLAEFPDSVTARGARHLAELTGMARAGHRAINLFLVQRTDCITLDLARDIDPAYAAAFAEAKAAGVETLCFAARITQAGVELGGPLDTAF